MPKLKAVLRHRVALSLLLLVNFGGAVYGFWWYRDQLAMTSLPYLVFVPDSPLAVLLFAVFLTFLLWGREIPWLKNLALSYALKYGLWTSLLLLQAWRVTGIFDFESFHLTLTHLGMALEALLFAWILGVDRFWLFVSGAFLLLNDAVDYGLGHYPRLPSAELTVFAAYLAVVLTLASPPLLLGAGRGWGEERVSRLKAMATFLPVIFFMLVHALSELFVEHSISNWLEWFLVSVAVFVGAAAFAESIFRSLTRYQSLLREAQARIHALFFHTPDAVFFFDREGRIKEANPAGEALLGFEVRGTSFFSYLSTGEEGGELKGMLATSGKIPYFEGRLRSPQGEEIPVSGSAVRLPGEEELYAVVLRDLREKEALEAEIEKRQKQAEALYRVGLLLSENLRELERGLAAATGELRSSFPDLRFAAWLVEGAVVGWELVPPARREGVEALMRESQARGEAVLSTPGEEISLLAVPVKMNREAVGALAVGFDSRRAISSADMLFFSSVAHQAAVALENRHLYLQAQGRGMLEERERLAKEMHDGLGQTLTYLSAMVGAMEQLLRKGRTEEARRQLVQAKEMLAEAHQEIRQAIFHLRQKPTEGGLVAQVAELLRQMEMQWGIKAELEAETDPSLSLPLEVESQVLRIVQEALTNVRKHAQARKVAVRFRPEGAVLRVEVEDDGRGFNLEEAKGMPGRFGLRIMEERAQAVGAELRIVSAPGRGARVELLVPALVPAGGRR